MFAGLESFCVFIISPLYYMYCCYSDDLFIFLAGLLSLYTPHTLFQGTKGFSLLENFIN